MRRFVEAGKRHRWRRAEAEVRSPRRGIRASRNSTATEGLGVGEMDPTDGRLTRTPVRLPLSYSTVFHVPLSSEPHGGDPVRRAVEELIDILGEAGVEFIFGVPGGGTVEIFTSLYGRDSAPRPVLVRQEHGATIMADAYARASRSPAAAMGQGPFIGANGAFGLMEAATSSSPVILIGDISDFGMTPRPVGQSVSGVYGSPDLGGMLRTMTKHTAVAATPKEAIIGLQMAIKHATTGCPGPTALLMRSNAITGEVDFESMPMFFKGLGYQVTETTVPGPGHVARAVDLLTAAQRPVILAGKGVHNAGAHESLRQLAEAWGAPVATTYKGKSAIAETHPLSLGMAGTFGRPTANQVVDEADLIIVVGAKLRTNDTAGGTLVQPERQRIVQIDIEPLHASWAIPADVNLVGDARVVLDLMLEASRDRSPTADSVDTRVRALQSRLEADAISVDPGAAEDATPVRPQRLARLLSEHLDPESNICLDAGNNRVWMGLFGRSQRAFSYFAPGGLAGMGWALPASLGVKLARPGQPSVAVTGDGGFMMSVHALATAVELDIPTTCVVMNDSGLGMVRQHQGNRVVASTFGATDHAAIARGFGAEGYTVTHSKELPEILEFVQREDKTAVIDVITDQEPSPDVFRPRPRALTET